ncbi:hypothetical protein J6590_070180 [Homalodisca vitripennis]|nr:hypothetical protein J6590_070180 [Homalodisca vitripennis]
MTAVADVTEQTQPRNLLFLFAIITVTSATPLRLLSLLFMTAVADVTEQLNPETCCSCLRCK